MKIRLLYDVNYDVNYFVISFYSHVACLTVRLMQSAMLMRDAFVAPVT